MRYVANSVEFFCYEFKAYDAEGLKEFLDTCNLDSSKVMCDQNGIGIVKTSGAAYAVLLKPKTFLVYDPTAKSLNFVDKETMEIFIHESE